MNAKTNLCIYTYTYIYTHTRTLLTSTDTAYILQLRTLGPSGFGSSEQGVRSLMFRSSSWLEDWAQGQQPSNAQSHKAPNSLTEVPCVHILVHQRIIEFAAILQALAKNTTAQQSNAQFTLFEFDSELAPLSELSGTPRLTDCGR